MSDDTFDDVTDTSAPADAPAADTSMMGNALPSGPDQFTDVSQTSFGGNISGSVVGMLFGIIMFIAAFPLLWWNEGRSVDTIKRLDEGRNKVVEISAGSIAPENNGKLVYLSGKADTSDILSDSVFGVHEVALRLKRKVEMYQWQESKDTSNHKTLGGGTVQQTTYSYSKVWSEAFINSSSFRHQAGHVNPSHMPFKTQTFTASNVHIGALALAGDFTKQMNTFSEYPLSQDNFSGVDPRMQQALKLSGTEYFHGDPDHPQIGAVRIQYQIIRPTDASVIGKQDNSSIIPYYTAHGDIAMLAMGIKGPAAMFKSAEDENLLITWGVRFGGFTLMTLGLAMLLGPLATIASIVPLIGNLVSAGIFLISLTIAAVLSFVTIAIAWIVLRPVIGIALLAGAACCMFGGTRLVARARAAIATSRMPGKTA